ncbi:MAG: PAS domain-containing protein [Rhizobium sp.]
MLPVLADGAGLFSWDMVANRVCGDAEMARLVNVDVDELRAGVPVELIIGRMHVDDRERIAKALHSAIVNGTLYREVYRVALADGEYCYVLCVARCFAYEDGLPTSCAGFVCEAESIEGSPKLRPQDDGNVIQFRKPS